MDLPTTQQTAITLNEELQKYKALYSEYIQHAIDLHNYHQKLITKPRRTLGPVVRKHIKEMIVLEKKLIIASVALCKARQADIKARKREKGIKFPTLAEKGQEIDYKNHGVIRNKQK